MCLPATLWILDPANLFCNMQCTTVCIAAAGSRVVKRTPGSMPVDELVLVRGRTPSSEIIGRGRYICRGSHTAEVLCVMCYITDIIDIIPGGRLARMRRSVVFEMRFTWAP